MLRGEWVRLLVCGVFESQSLAPRRNSHAPSTSLLTTTVFSTGL